jgi:uncharacterized cupin superfamily protein
MNVTARPGVLRVSVLDAPLQPDPLDPGQVLEGDPQTSDHTLATSADGRATSGVWSCSPGTFADVEVDETFVVVSGRATIQAQDEAPVDVGPGDLCVLRAGTRTVWTVHEELVKGYVLVAEPGR